MSTVPRALFEGLVDDAALFPPGNAPMDRALADHLSHRMSWYAGVVGPFVAPASRLDELRAALTADDTLGLALVVDVAGDAAHSALRTIAADRRLTLTLVEARRDDLGPDVEAVGANLSRLPATHGYLEAPRAGWEGTFDLVASSGGWYGVKLRAGGETPDAVPSEDELAAWLRAAVDREVPVKLTAGLHSAVRRTDDAAGVERHGFLNVLVAVRAALIGADSDEMARLLAVRDAAEVLDAAGRMSEPDAMVVRQFLHSFGCCAVTDPIEDLVALGVLHRAQPA